MAFVVDAAAGGVVGQGEAEDVDLLAFEAVGDHALVPQALVELVVDGFRIAAVGVGELVGAGVLGDLLEVFGAVEVPLCIARAPLAG